MDDKRTDMSKKAVSLICAIAISLSLISFHADAQGVRVPGEGQATCGDWIQYRYTNDSVRQVQAVEWVSGFVTGYSWYHLERQAYLSDAKIVFGWLDAYCHNNPTFSVVTAAAALIQQLGGEPTRFQWKQ